MNYFKSKTSILITVVAAGLSVASCNSGSSSDTMADTTTTTGTYSDTTSSMPADTTSTMATDTSMKSTDTASKKSTASKTSASKKKGKITISMLSSSKHPKVTMDKSGVYEFSEVMPAYPGGESALENYVTNNVNYPDAALNDGKEGKINVAFTVDENGKVTDAHSVSNKLGDGLDEEAVRVISSMPAWTPGTVKGKPVKARITLPITFQIQE